MNGVVKRAARVSILYKPAILPKHGFPVFLLLLFPTLCLFRSSTISPFLPPRLPYLVSFAFASVSNIVQGPSCLTNPPQLTASGLLYLSSLLFFIIQSLAVVLRTMSEYWSDEDSADTVAPDAKSRASRRSAKPPSIRTEAKHMLNSIKKKRGPDDEFVIAVVRNGSVEALEQRLPGAKSWYEPLFKSMFFSLHTMFFSLHASGRRPSLVGSSSIEPHVPFKGQHRSPVSAT